MRVTSHILLFVALISIGGELSGQELEPRRWSHLPSGINFIGLGTAYTFGDIHFNPVLRIEDAEVDSAIGSHFLALLDGALHLLLSPVDLLALIAITLLAGSAGAGAGRWTAVMLPLTWLIAGFSGLQSGAGLESTWFSVISLLVFGGLVASGWQLAPAVVATLAALYGAAPSSALFLPLPCFGYSFIL